jgi:predicted ATPase
MALAANFRNLRSLQAVGDGVECLFILEPGRFRRRPEESPVSQLLSLRLAGWKSIRETKVELRPLNVVIGANGAGKSNFVSFFRMLNEMIGERLQEFIARAGYAHSLLHFGPKRTPLLEAELVYQTDTGQSRYYQRLAAAAGGQMIFVEERLEFQRPGYSEPLVRNLGAGHAESRLNLDAERDNKTVQVIRATLRDCRVFHFHDTSETARVRQPCYLNANRRLFPDAGNLAAMLYGYRQTRPTIYRRILATVRQIAPFLDDFILEPQRLNPNEIRLDWRARGSDYEFGPHQFSDGALRSIALATLLLQPEDELPDVILLDEPELGLHPNALGVLASLLKKASHHCQVVIATQSTVLLDHFDLEDVIVVQQRGGESTFERLDPEAYREWREEYSVSELWAKNVIGGGPS